MILRQGWALPPIERVHLLNDFEYCLKASNLFNLLLLRHRRSRAGYKVGNTFIENVMAVSIITFVFLLFFVGVDGVVRKEASLINTLRRAIGGDRYVAKGSLLTPAEKNFMYSLQRVAKDMKLILAIKVRVADIIVPRKTLSKREWWKRFRFLSQKHIDFVFVDQNFMPIIAVELNDRSHMEKGRASRDKELKEVFNNASVPLLFVPASRKYNQVQLHSALLTEVKRHG